MHTCMCACVGVCMHIYIYIYIYVCVCVYLSLAFPNVSPAKINSYLSQCLNFVLVLAAFFLRHMFNIQWLSLRHNKFCIPRPPGDSGVHFPVSVWIRAMASPSDSGSLGSCAHRVIPAYESMTASVLGEGSVAFHQRLRSVLHKHTRGGVRGGVVV